MSATVPRARLYQQGARVLVVGTTDGVAFARWFGPAQ